MTRTKPAAEYPFRATLQRLRLKKKMTQQQLAEKLGVSPVTVSGWELGRRVPEPHTLSRIAQLFGTSVDNLLGYSKTAETFQAGDIAYVPMYGSVAILEGRLAFLDFHGTYPVPAEAAKVPRGVQAVLITVPDSSMASEGIREGCKVLTHVNAAMVRLDRSYIKDLGNSENVDTIASLISKVNTSGASCLMAFIEDPAAMSAAWTVGARYLQGNFLQSASDTMHIVTE